MSDPAQFDEAPPDRPTGCRGLAVPVGLLLFVTAVVIAFALSRFEGSSNNGPRHPAVGQMLPPVELHPLTGDSRPIGPGDLAGRVVLLNFWGTWCPPCVAELADIARIESDFRNRPDFLLLAVSCGEELPEDLQQLRQNTTALLSAEQIDMPTYADPDATTRQAINQVVALRYVPTTLLADRGGVIRGVWVGPVEKDELEELVLQLLAEQ